MGIKDFIPTVDQKFLLKFFMIDYILKHSDTPEGAAYRNEKPENIQKWLREFPRPIDRELFISRGYKALKEADYEWDKVDVSLRWKYAWANLEQHWEYAHAESDYVEHIHCGFPRAGYMSPSQAWGFLEFLGIDPKERWHIVYDEERPYIYWMPFDEKDNWETASAPTDSEWWQLFGAATTEYEVLKAAFGDKNYE